MKKILITTVPLSRTGAAMALLNLLRELNMKSLDVRIDLYALGKGELEPDFARIVSKIYFAENGIVGLFDKFSEKVLSWKSILLGKLSRNSYDLVIANSISSLDSAYRISKDSSSKLILYLHEYKTYTKIYGKDFRVRINHIDHFIVVAPELKSMLITDYSVSEKKIDVIYPIIKLNDSKIGLNSKDEKQSLIVGGSGYMQYVKGVDVFLQVAHKISCRHPKLNIQFVWVGGTNEYFEALIQADVAKLGLTEKVILSGHLTDTSKKYDQFDVVLLTSREEAFSLFAYEIGLKGKPIIAFENTGGTSAFLKANKAKMAEYMDIDTMVAHVIDYYNNPDLIISDGKRISKAYQSIDNTEQVSKLSQVIQSFLLSTK